MLSGRAYPLSGPGRRSVTSNFQSLRRQISNCHPKRAQAGPAQLPRSLPRGSARSARPPPSQATVPFNLAQSAARKLYAQGVREVFQAPGHNKWFLTSWAIGLVSIGGAINLLDLRMYDDERTQSMQGFQKSFVAAANRISIVFLTLLGGFAILRYSGFIRSMRLVEHGNGDILMDLRVRRRTPWSQTRYMLLPGDMTMPRDWRSAQAQYRKQIELRKSSNSAVKVFRACTNFALMQGLASPIRFSNNESYGIMDPEGITVPVEDFGKLVRERGA